MLQVTLLGTGGMLPLPERHLASCLIRCEGSAFLVDCGEGTQVALRRQGLGFKAIEAICLTHFHADHIVGLPGLLLTIGNSGRTEPLTIYGPRHTQTIASYLCVVAQNLPFPVEFTEWSEAGGEAKQGPLRIEAFRVKHDVPCFGYAFHLDRAPRFLPEKAEALGLPKPLWNRLQHGETVTNEGRTVKPAQVSGPPRRGLKLCYCTDSRPTASIAGHAKGADLFICEGMYGDRETIEKNHDKKHMNLYEAAALARDAGCRKLWLTHYSPSMASPLPYMGEVRRIFPAAFPGEDGLSVELPFDEP